MARRIKVLIAEDEAVILRHLESLVAGMGSPFAVVGKAPDGDSAVEMIHSAKPDIVLCDIHMPYKTGLELIREARDSGSDARFVILSGYSEFAYAREALVLGVVDYLLKPVDPEALAEVFQRIRREREEEWAELRRQYIMSELSLTEPCRQGNPLLQTTAQLAYAYIGTLSNRVAGELDVGHGVWQSLDYRFLEGIASRLDVEIHHFFGKYPNEHIFVCVSSGDIRGLELAEELRASIDTEGMFLNVILSPPVRDGQNIREAENQVYITAATALPFGRSAVLEAGQGEDRDLLPNTDPELLELEQAISLVINKPQLQERLQELLAYWQRVDPPQIQLHNQMQHLLSRCLYRSAVQECPDPWSLLSTAPGYEDLIGTLQEELIQLLGFGHTPENYNARDLIDQVKQYLDHNFTRPITGKSLKEKFGYNEKYLTDVFKGRMGTTPSRYVLELRINTAMRLLNDNPGLLLKDVASQVGYGDPLYFSRVFKDLTGQSPSRYVQSLEQER